MYKLIVFSTLIALSFAAVNRNYNPHYAPAARNVAPSSDDVHAEIRLLQSDVRADGYDYALETTNGIHAAQSGDAYGNVHGDYEYVSPEGEHVRVTYVADENGYQPQSDVLPTPPPIPDAILRSLEYIRTHPHQEDRYGPVVQHVSAAQRAPAVQRSQFTHNVYGRHH